MKTKTPIAKKIERERKEAIKIEKKVARDILKQFNYKDAYDEEGFPIPKISYKKPKDGRVGIFTITCGDGCKNRVKISDNVLSNSSLEINGVIASKKIWKKILLPLLNTYGGKFFSSQP